MSEVWIEMVPGIKRRTLVSGEQMMLILVTLEAGSELPEHHHPHEQISYVMHGLVRFFIAGEQRDVQAGEYVLLPGGVPHGVRALKQSAVLDTFSPPREDMLAQDRAATA
ncbi:MAG: cupin domain-containing protein [Roseiflexaceae bacterium]